MKHKVCIVHWKDACVFTEYSQHGLTNLYSCGFLVYEDDEYITLSQDLSLTPKADYRNSLSIPKVNIISMSMVEGG